MNALTGQQLAPFPDSNSHEDNPTPAGYSDKDDINDTTCPISHCGRGIWPSDCGEHAHCINGYCQCVLGWKPAGGMGAVRGWTGLESLTVWSGAANEGCMERCDSLTCEEVEQYEGCFDGEVEQGRW